MREKTLVSFKILSATLSPQELEAKIGLKADESWKAGDMRGTFATKEKQNGWVLESKAAISASAEEHVQAMLKRLEEAATRIGALAEQATIQLVVELHRKSYPALHLTRDDVRWLGVMGATMDLDVFILTDAPRAGTDAAKKPA